MGWTEAVNWIRSRIAVVLATVVLVAAAILAALYLTGGTATSVAFLNTSLAQRPVLLFSGWVDGKCQRFMPVRAVTSTTVPIGSVWAGYPWCPAEVVAFAQGSGAVASPWPGRPGSTLTLTSDVLQVPLPWPRALKVHLWIFDGGGAVPDWVNEDVQTAQDLFPAFGVGVVLDTLASVSPPSDALIQAFKKECDGFDVLSATGYDPDRLNIYLMIVDGMWGQGMSCAKDGHPDVALVWSDQYRAALAHELGHLMGLLEPSAYSGHTVGLPGFRDGDCPGCGANLMIASIDEVKDVSLGQVFRMNLDSDSWWNLGVGSPFAGSTRTCQDPIDTDVPCPLMALR